MQTFTVEAVISKEVTMFFMQLFVLSVVLLVGCLASNPGTCPTDNYISKEDVQAAFCASYAVYYTTQLNDEIKCQNGDYKSGYIIKESIEQIYTATSGYKVIVADKGSNRIIAFRGTDREEQLLEQISLEQEILHNDYKKIKVSKFYLDAFNILYPFINNTMRNSSKRYIMTGHSLGGALAAILAMKTAIESKNIVWNHDSSLITFGQPRVGNIEFANEHDRLISPYRKLRFVLHKDFVPHWPFYPTFKHFSGEVYMDKNRRNQKYWLVCKNEETVKLTNAKCSKKHYWFMLSISEHKMANYESYVMSLSAVMKDKNENAVSSLEQALAYSC